MKAIQIQSPGNVAVVDVEKPTLKAGEVLLKLGFVDLMAEFFNAYHFC